MKGVSQAPRTAVRGAAVAAIIGVCDFAAPTMTPAASASLSGMTAAQTRLDVAGHNVANLQTEGFRRQVAQPASAEPGVTVSIGQMPEAGNDLAADTVGMIEAQHAFGANLMAFRTQDAMTASLLDLEA